MKTLIAKTAIWAAIFCAFGIEVQAEDISDTVTDVEEITADSEAAKLRARDASAEVARERVENAKALRAAMKTKQEAETKRQQAANSIKSSEIEIERLAGEYKSIQRDIDKLQFNILAAERIIQKSKEKIEERKKQNASLATIRKEKVDRLNALNKEQMDVVRAASAAEDEHALLKRDLEKVTQDEMAATKSIEKSKAETALRRVELEKRIVELKERYRQGRQHRLTADIEARKAKQINYRLEGTVKAGQNEVESGEAVKQPIPMGQPPAAQQEDPQASQLLDHDRLAGGR